MRKVITSVVLASALSLGLAGNAEAGIVDGHNKAYAKVEKTNTSTWSRYRVYKVATWQLGDPYKWGAEGPHRFDCSGLVQYAHKRAGKWVPRTTSQQFNRTKDISWRQRVKGDLIFFKRKGSSYPFHVGIYAGNGRMIHANYGDYYGKKVIRERITPYWSKKFRADYRRVR